MTVSCLLPFVVVAINEIAQYGTVMYDFLSIFFLSSHMQSVLTRRSTPHSIKNSSRRNMKTHLWKEQKIIMQRSRVWDFRSSTQVYLKREITVYLFIPSLASAHTSLLPQGSASNCFQYSGHLFWWPWLCDLVSAPRPSQRLLAHIHHRVTVPSA